MKKYLIAMISVVMMALCIAGCSQDNGIESGIGSNLARKWGASGEVKLPPGQKLVTVTYKGNGKGTDSLWFLYRPMRDDEKPEVYTFQEDSMFGILEGTVTIIESR